MIRYNMYRGGHRSISKYRVSRSQESGVRGQEGRRKEGGRKRKESGLFLSLSVLAVSSFPQMLLVEEIPVLEPIVDKDLLPCLNLLTSSKKHLLLAIQTDLRIILQSCMRWQSILLSHQFEQA